MAHGGATDSIEGSICIYGGNASTATPCMTGYTPLACIQGDSINETWQLYEVTFIPPENFTYLAIAGECPSTTSLNGQYVYVDDMFLCERPCLTTWIDNVTIVPISDDTCGMNTGSMTVDFTTQCYTGFNFEWKQGAVVMSTDSIATGLAAGSYSLGITDSNCSTYMIGPSISAFNPITSITITPSSASICPGDSISLLASGATNYTWTPGSGLSCTSCPNPMAGPSSTTTYQAIGSMGSCSDSASITITVSTTITTSDQAAICTGDSVFLEGTWQTTAGTYTDTMAATSTGCDSLVITTLTVHPAITTSSNADLCLGDSLFVGGAYQTIGGAYMDTLSSAAGCDSVVTTSLFIYNPPLIQLTNDTSITLGSVIDLIAYGGNTYFWNTGETTSNISVSPTQTTTYSLIAINGPGCADTAFVTVIVEEMVETELFTPNIFSPNGDGSNDVFYVRGTGFDEFQLIIYNRWGEKVFETEDNSKGWDGTYEEEPLNPGVYVYYVFVRYIIDGKEVNKKGNITLIR
jgi:gliding motility-associated-like protein